MGILYWTIIIIMFAAGFAGLVIPVIPGVLFTVGGFIVYGLFYSFEPFNWLFWIVQVLLVILLMSADYAANLFGVKKYGGSKAGIWGSTIGLIAGPFVIPAFGILIGPFLGAMLAEMIFHRTDFQTACKIGLGSVAGFVGSTIVKGFIQLVMIGYFLLLIFL